METAILKAIKDMTARKVKRGISPTHVTRIEIEKEVSNALNNLYTNGEIEVGKTANDKWIKATE